MGRASRQNDAPSSPLRVTPTPYLTVYQTKTTSKQSQPLNKSYVFHCGRCGKDVPHGPPVTCGNCGAKRESSMDVWR